MPFLAPVIAAAGAAVSSFFTLAGIGAFLGKVALNFALSALVGKLTSNKKSSGSFASEVRDQQVVVRSSIQPRNIIYGTSVTSGPLVFAHVSGADKSFMHLVVVLASHEVASIDSVFFNDEEILSSQIDGAGDVIAGRFSGHARIRKYLGTASQVADPSLVSEAPGIWTPNHTLSGIAYLYVRLKFSRDVYAGGLPNIKAVVRGKKLHDPRDGQTRWSANPALAVRDYLISTYGLGASPGEIEDVICAASASICEERVLVTQSGTAITFSSATDEGTVDSKVLRFGDGDGVRFTTGGTLPSPLATGTTYYMVRTTPSTLRFATTSANARDRVFIDLTTAGSGVHQMVHHDQMRYTANGSLSMQDGPRDNIRTLLTAMAGALPWVQGKYEIRAGAYAAPTLALDDDDLRAPLSVITKAQRKDLFNSIKGVYVEPNKYWQPTDFPVVINAAYETQDGSVRITRDIDLAFTDNQIRAQRIGKIHLEKSRQGITVTFPAKLRAMETKPWATVTLTIAHLGWSNKVFRVVNWSLSPEGGVDLSLQEESSASYNWATGDATAVDSAPDTNLPSAITVVAPTGLVLDSGSDQAFVNTDGTVIVRVFASWVASSDVFVTAYEFQWKRSTESEYQSSVLSPQTLRAFIEPAAEGITYDVRVRALNKYGAASTFISSSLLATGKDTPPGAPSSLASETVPAGVKLTWVNPVDNDLSLTEVWEASSNDQALATRVAEVSANFFTRTALAPGAVRYYWVRAVDTTGNLSVFHPSSSTAGVSGTAGSTTGVVNYADVTGTKPPANADNTAGAVNAGTSVTSGGITFSLGGSIKGGQTDYHTAVGWFLGYSSGQYRFSIGNPAGNFMTWDGATLQVAGNIQKAPITYSVGTSVLYHSNNTTVSSQEFTYAGEYGRKSITKSWVATSTQVYNVSCNLWRGSSVTACLSTTVFIEIKVDGVITQSYITNSQTAVEYPNVSVGLVQVGSTISIELGFERWGTFDCFLQAFNSRFEVRGGTEKVFAASPGNAMLYGVSYHLLKSIKLPYAGTVKTRFVLLNDGAQTVFGRIYRNGIAVGTERSTGAAGRSAPFEENISVSANDTVQLWGRQSFLAIRQSWVDSFQLLSLTTNTGEYPESF